MSGPEEEKGEKVGYGKPPAAHRFTPGRSGNPKGRPKGSRNFSTDARQMLDMSVPYEQGGKRKRLTTQQAALVRLREKALRGEERALDRLLEIARCMNDEDAVSAAPVDLPIQDEKIIEGFANRVREDAARALAAAIPREGDGLDRS